MQREATYVRRDALIAIIREKALRVRASSRWPRARRPRITWTASRRRSIRTGARLVAEGILDLLGPGPMPAAVGGMSIGADPITACGGRHVGGPRHAARGLHGPQGSQRDTARNQYIEGRSQPGETVVIVEDVVTTGGSSLLAIERCEAFGLKVVGVSWPSSTAWKAAPRPSPHRGYPLAQPVDDPRFRHRAAQLVLCVRIEGMYSGQIWQDGCHCWLVQQCCRPAVARHCWTSQQWHPRLIKPHLGDGPRDLVPP